MIKPEPDHRSANRRQRDEHIAAGPRLQPPALAPDVLPHPVEHYLVGRAHPVALAGVVENGLIRPLDPTVKLPENARVIIVASNGT